MDRYNVHCNVCESAYEFHFEITSTWYLRGSKSLACLVVYMYIYVYFFKPNKKIILRGNVCLYFNVTKKEKKYIYDTNFIISVMIIGIKPILFACMVNKAYKSYMYMYVFLTDLACY